MFAADDVSDNSNSDQIKTVFQNTQGKKSIDVYWIADDGGEPTEVLFFLFSPCPVLSSSVAINKQTNNGKKLEESLQFILLINKQKNK